MLLEEIIVIVLYTSCCCCLLLPASDAALKEEGPHWAPLQQRATQKPPPYQLCVGLAFQSYPLNFSAGRVAYPRFESVQIGSDDVVMVMM